jgi:hypothetical protein
MVAYEIYYQNYQIGTLLERRNDPVRTTHDSVMNWATQILGENTDFNDIFFITITIDEHSGEITRPRFP